MTDESRTATPIDTIADAWVDTLAELHPTLATYIGRFEFNDRFGDYSPEGAERIAEEARQTLAALRGGRTRRRRRRGDEGSTWPASSRSLSSFTTRGGACAT